MRTLIILLAPTLFAIQELDDAQKRQLAALPRDYAAAKGDFEAQMAVALQAKQLGETAVKRMTRPIQRDQQAAFRVYSRLLPAAAQATADPTVEKVLKLPKVQEARGRLEHFSRMSHVLADEQGAYEESPAARQLNAFEQRVVVQVRNAAAFLTLDQEEAMAIRDTNVERLKRGLAALEVDPKLCLAAADHSADMARLGFFSHNSPVPGKASFTDRARKFGAAASAENIAATGGGGAKAVQMWMDSDGHRRNILSPGARRIGVGRVGKHYTQLFGR